jgi:hypothetical protein
VESEVAKMPTEYHLSQNYPNPFNPVTQIDFSIPKEGETTLKVYDVRGREVATLMDEKLNAGHYTVHFDAATLPSGTYIYTLKSRDHVVTKKLMLMK